MCVSVFSWALLFSSTFCPARLPCRQLEKPKTARIRLERAGVAVSGPLIFYEIIVNISAVGSINLGSVLMFCKLRGIPALVLLRCIILLIYMTVTMDVGGVEGKQKVLSTTIIMVATSYTYFITRQYVVVLVHLVSGI